MATSEGFVYVLRSTIDSSLYLGSTNDIHRRLREHNEGTSASTRHKRPWVLWFALRFSHISHARNAEQVLKAQKRKIALSWILEILGKHISHYGE